MFLAMFMRIALLFGINLIDSNEKLGLHRFNGCQPELRDKVSYYFWVVYSLFKKHQRNQREDREEG
jgi:hypothetical protein